MARKSTRIRSAITGRFVSSSKAKTNPNTTVKETIKVGPTKKRKSK